MVAADGIHWQMWHRDDYPHWSLPALEAAKCAALQSETAFEDMHFRLFRSFFEQGVNIARADEVLAVARQAPLDYDRFIDDFAGGTTRPAVLDDYEQALNTYWVHAIPTVIFNDRERAIGPVPFEHSVKRLERLGIACERCPE